MVDAVVSQTGLDVELASTTGSAQDVAQVRVTGQSLDTMEDALLLALNAALSQRQPHDR